MSRDFQTRSQEPQKDSTPVIRRRVAKSQRNRQGLIQYAHSVHSQNGEDGILARLFSLIPPAFLKSCTTSKQNSSSTVRWCVDVGAWDGMHLSNTHELLFSKDSDSDSDLDFKWRGVLLEADHEKFGTLQNRHTNTQNICLKETISTHSINDPHNLCNILPTTAPDLPDAFDFLCIDIDGSDYWVWHDLLLRNQYSATVVCIEFNPTMPDDLIYIPPRDERHGASLSALVELAETYNYVLVETTLYNAFFVQHDVYKEYLTDEVPDTSIEALHESTMGTELYQLYDGTIKLWGCKKLLWHRIALNEEKMQVLPEHKRRFPFAPTIKSTSTTEEEEKEDLSCWTRRAVDLASLFHQNDDLMTDPSNVKVCEELLQQLEDDGFAFIRGSNVDSQLCQTTLHQTHQLLQVADESVRRSCLSTTDRARRGYAPMNVENFASLLGKDGPNDLVRKFRVGPLQSEGENSLLQPNIWPTEEWNQFENFRASIEKYYTAACEVAHMTLQAICVALMRKYPELQSALAPLQSISNGLSDDDNCKTTTTSILTLLGYRTGTRHKGKGKGPLVAAHTDVGVITMLLFDGGSNTCASLQKQRIQENGEICWDDVKLPKKIPSDPIWVINVADCLSELSGQRLPSTIHRVVAQRQSQIPRNCAALFVGLDPSTKIEIEGKIMTYEEWRRQRIYRSQQVLQDAVKKA